MDIRNLIRENIRNLAPYSTARDDYQGTELSIALDANENPYDNGVNRYPDPRQKALKARLSQIKGVPVESIFVGNGSDEPIDLVYRVFCEPKMHNAVAITPTYSMYKVAAEINDVEVREVQLEEDFSLDADKLLAATDANTRLLWLCSPNNPTANSFPTATIERIIREFAGIVVLDEATSMLDPQGRADIMRVLDELQDRGTTIILVTHHADELEHADRVIQLEAGHIVGDGPADERLRMPVQSVGLPKRIDDEPAETLIEARDISYRYVDAERDVFNHLSFSIGKGETVALMGRNGAGKTTLARMLCALEKPTTGSIVIDGIAVATAKANGGTKPLNRKNRTRLRRTVGYVMQHPERQLFADTVAEDVAYGPSNLGLDTSEAMERAMQAMRLLHIEHLRDRSPFDLSGGQQRLVAIAGVIACEPKALILDEPTAGLDEEAAARVHGLIHELKSRGVTILLISHSQDEVDELADRTIILGKPAKRADSKESTESTVKATCEEEPDAESSVDAAGSDTATVGERRTLLERLDPRVGMLSALALMFSAFAIGSFWQLLLAVVFAGVIAAAGRINVGRLAASVRVFLALFVFCGLLNIFFVRTGTTVASLGPIPITDDGIRIAILYACRFAVVIVIGAMFLASTTPTAMTDAFESLLSPFARFGLHTQETALVMSLALRFLPTLGVETKAIIDAQSARGGSVETGSFVVRIKAMVAVVVPVFAAAIRHADNLSLALDARCYEEGATRTHWRVMRVTGMDVAVAIVVLVYLVALVVPGVLL